MQHSARVSVQDSIQGLPLQRAGLCSQAHGPFPAVLDHWLRKQNQVCTVFRAVVRSASSLFKHHVDKRGKRSVDRSVLLRGHGSGEYTE